MGQMDLLVLGERLVRLDFMVAMVNMYVSYQYYQMCCTKVLTRVTEVCLATQVSQAMMELMEQMVMWDQKVLLGYLEKR